MHEREMLNITNDDERANCIATNRGSVHPLGQGLFLRISDEGEAIYSQRWPDGDVGDVCVVSAITGEPRVDVYEESGLGPVDLMRFMRVMAFAGGRMLTMANNDNVRHGFDRIAMGC